MSELLKDIQATVMRQTAEALDELTAQCSLSVGEVIDRLVLQMRPENPDVALEVAESEIFILISNLSREDAEKVIWDLATELSALVVKDKSDGEKFLQAAMEARKKSIEAAKMLSAEEKEELKKLMEKDKPLEETEHGC